MIYNTTLHAGAGGVWTDANGKPLIAIGNANLYEGKNVWTDGKIIYGYDIPAFMPRKIKVKEKGLLIPMSCELASGSNYNYSYINLAKQIVGELTGTGETGKTAYFSGENCYLLEDTSTGVTITKADANSPFTVTIANNMYQSYLKDIGRNGGLVFYNGNIAYVNANMIANTWTGNDIFETIKPVAEISDTLPTGQVVTRQPENVSSMYFRWWNIDDNGIVTVVLFADDLFYKYMYIETPSGTVYYLPSTYRSYVFSARIVNGNFDANIIGTSGQYTNTVTAGDGTYHRAENVFTYENAQGHEIEIAGMQGISEYTGQHLTVTKNHCFVTSMAYGRNKVLQYSLDGTFEKEYDSGVGSSYLYCYNARLDEIDMKAAMKQWGFL